MSKSKVKDRRSDASVKRSSISELAGKVSFLICGNQYDLSVDRAQDLAGASSTSHIIGLLSPTRTLAMSTRGISSAASPAHSPHAQRHLTTDAQMKGHPCCTSYCHTVVTECSVINRTFCH